MEEDLLVAVNHPGQVDPDIELLEDLQLYLAARYRNEGQRRDDVRVTGVPGSLFTGVQRVLGLDRGRVLADLLPADQEVVVVAVVGPDDVACE